MATEPTTPFSTELLAWLQATFGLASTTQAIDARGAATPRATLPQATATTISGKYPSYNN